jgi:hypothetical protein
METIIMSANSRTYLITDSSDSSPLVVASDSREIILRNIGEGDVYFGFNAPISTDSNGPYGVFIQKGEYIVLTKIKSDADIYMRCLSGETATVMGEIK